MLSRLARGARIVLNGGVSQYAAGQARGPANYLALIGARVSMTGFLTPDYSHRYPAARAELAGWLDEGRLISREDILEGGVRAFPDVLPKLFTGGTSASSYLPCRGPMAPGGWMNPGRVVLDAWVVLEPDNRAGAVTARHSGVAQPDLMRMVDFGDVWREGGCQGQPG